MQEAVGIAKEEQDALNAAALAAKKFSTDLTRDSLALAKLNSETKSLSTHPVEIVQMQKSTTSQESGALFPSVKTSSSDLNSGISSENARKQAQETTKLNNVLNENISATNRLSAANKSNSASVAELDYKYGLLTKEGLTYARAIADLNNKLASGEILQKDYNKYLNLATAAYDRDTAAAESNTDATRRNANITREKMVLLHEGFTGNWTRMGGSLMVLSEYSNGLGILGNAMMFITSPAGMMALAVAAVGVTIAKAAISSDQLTQSFNKIQMGLSVTNSSFVASNEKLKQYRLELSNLPDVGNKAADEILSSFSRMKLGSQEFFDTFISHIDKYAQLFGTDAVAATKRLENVSVDASEEYKKFVDEGILPANSALETQIDVLQKSGDKAGAAKLVYAQLTETQKSHTEVVTNLKEKTHDLTAAWNSFTNALKDNSAISMVNNLLGNMLTNVTDVLNLFSNNIDIKIDNANKKLASLKLTPSWQTKGQDMLASVGIGSSFSADVASATDELNKLIEERDKLNTNANTSINKSANAEPTENTSVSEYAAAADSVRNTKNATSSLITASKELLEYTTLQKSLEKGIADQAKILNGIKETGNAINGQTLEQAQEELKSLQEQSILLDKNHSKAIPAEANTWNTEQDRKEKETLANATEGGKTITTKEKKEIIVTVREEELKEALVLWAQWPGVIELVREKLNEAKTSLGTVSNNSGTKELKRQKDIEVTTLNEQLAQTGALGLKKLEQERDYWNNYVATVKQGSDQYIQLKKQISQLDEQIAVKKIEDTRSGASSDANTEIKLLQISYNTKKEQLSEDVANHKISEDEKITQLTEYLSKIHQKELDELNKELTYYDTNEAKYKEILNKKKEMNAEYNQQIAELSKKAAQEDEKVWTSAAKSISGVFSNTLNTMLDGNSKIGPALGKALKSALKSLVSTGLQDDFANLFSKIGLGSIGGKSSGGSGIFGSIISLFSGSSKGSSGSSLAESAATTANTTAITASTAAVTGHAATLAVNTATTTANTIAGTADTSATLVNSGSTLANTTGVLTNTTFTELNTAGTTLNTAATETNTSSLLSQAWGGVKSLFGFLASGTSGASKGLAWTGEKGPELSIDKNGNTSILGTHGPELKYMQGGEQVVPADYTRKILNSTLNVGKVSKYASGVGNLVLPSTSITSAMSNTSNKFSSSNINNSSASSSSVVHYSPTTTINGSQMSGDDFERMLSRSHVKLAKIVNKLYTDGKIKVQA
jgi:hypothetical protein